MNILIATSEAAPLAKTGGLADVCGALPKALRSLGHKVALIMPAYRSTKAYPTTPTGIEIRVTIAGREVRGAILECECPAIGVPVFLVEHNHYYDRAGLYNQNNQDFGDNCERFVFFSYAVMEAIRQLSLPVDILHVNDWQTGLIPALLSINYRDIPGFERISTLCTIHNIAYQGSFPAQAMSLTGLHWKYFNWLQMECYDHLNLLKTGIVFSDGITTVSPTYAREITAYPGGNGLEGVLRNRTDVLWGITNGIDTDEWSPGTDPFLPQNYDVETYRAGKDTCKLALQQQLGLPQRRDVPLIGLVGRLTEQKGFDLAVELIYRKTAENADVQWALLGSGDPQLENHLRNLNARYPGSVGVAIRYSNALAHEIIAASDIFLMPSRFEPCGLTQMYSLHYGTVPVVHSTGGLVDTVVDATPDSLADGSATGIQFRNADMDGIIWGVNRALDTYANRPDEWSQMIRTGMTADLSWKRSAQRYVEIYRKIRRHRPRKSNL